MDFLLAEVSKAAQKKSLKVTLHKHLSRREEARSIRRIHASAVTKSDFCGRFYALSDLIDYKAKDEWITTSEQVTYHLGRVLQDSVVNWLADVGIAVGHWKCNQCKWPHLFCKRPVKCEKCGENKFTPKEVEFKSLISGIGGSFDCLVNIGEPKLRLVEIKTMDKDQFKLLKQPLPEHRLRTKLYMRLAAESSSAWKDRIDTAAAIVFYVSKGGYGVADPDLANAGVSDKFSPFKEFLIERDDEATQVVSDKGRYVSDWRKGKAESLPPKLCDEALQKAAQWCPLRSVCWSDAFPENTQPKSIEES